MDLSEQEKGEIRVDLVPLFQMLAGFGCIFWVHLGESMTAVGRFWCDFRKVYIGALYVVGMSSMYETKRCCTMTVCRSRCVSIVYNMLEFNIGQVIHGIKSLLDRASNYPEYI